MQLNSYQIQNFQSQKQQILDINLVYATYGALNKNKDNAILVLTSYSATHEDAEDLFARSDLLDLSNHCVKPYKLFLRTLGSREFHRDEV